LTFPTPTFNTPEIFYSIPQSVNPTIPIFTSGILVIESDDGDDGDYYIWLNKSNNYPLKLWQLSELPTQFHDAFQKHHNKYAVACSDVNGSTIGTAGKMTVTQLLELQNDYGWEIFSHSYVHLGMGSHVLSAQASSGQNIINTPQATYFENFIGTNYRVHIFDGVNDEELSVIAIDPDGHHITVSPNLQHSYMAGAHVQITYESAMETLEENIPILEGWGINKVRGFVFPYHDGSHYNTSQTAINWAATVYEHVRGMDTSTGTNDLSTINLQNLNAVLLSTLTVQSINSILDITVQNNYLTIVYNHGGMDGYLLTHFILGAFSRGIKILTRTQALQELNLIN
jgi:hypothetical protein